MSNHPAPTVYWLDLDGTECATRCFDEHHALRLEESHEAAGIWHTRDARKLSREYLEDKIKSFEPEARGKTQ